MLRAQFSRNCSATRQFQWAPTLGGECYQFVNELFNSETSLFQWAPTLGGECYAADSRLPPSSAFRWFQWAPTLGGECYLPSCKMAFTHIPCFNGHPPLGVNATVGKVRIIMGVVGPMFQWAPTLGGECYMMVQNQEMTLERAFQWAPTLGGECYFSQPARL